MTGLRGVVVDASVFVADIITTEPHHADAHGFLLELATRGVPIHVPSIVWSEIAAAVARGSAKPSLALRAVALYRQWPGIRSTAVDEDVADRAVVLAANQRIRGCDAIYVALAQSLGAALVTLDRQQRSRAPAGMAVLTPGEAVAAFDAGPRRQGHRGQSSCAP